MKCLIQYYDIVKDSALSQNYHHMQAKLYELILSQMNCKSILNVMLFFKEFKY